MDDGTVMDDGCTDERTGDDGWIEEAAALEGTPGEDGALADDTVGDDAGNDDAATDDGAAKEDGTIEDARIDETIGDEGAVALDTVTDDGTTDDGTTDDGTTDDGTTDDGIKLEIGLEIADGRTLLANCETDEKGGLDTEAEDNWLDERLDDSTALFSNEPYLAP